jgi:hypothetical protein
MPSNDHNPKDFSQGNTIQNGYSMLLGAVDVLPLNVRFILLYMHARLSLVNYAWSTNYIAGFPGLLSILPVHNFRVIK